MGINYYTAAEVCLLVDRSAKTVAHGSSRTNVVEEEEEEEEAGGCLFIITTAITQTPIIIYPTSYHIAVTNSNQLAKTVSQKQSL